MPTQWGTRTQQSPYIGGAQRPYAQEDFPSGQPGTYLTRPSVPGWYTGVDPFIPPSGYAQPPGIAGQGWFESLAYEPGATGPGVPGSIGAGLKTGPFREHFWRAPADAPMTGLPLGVKRNEEPGTFSYQPPGTYRDEATSYEATRRWLDPRLFSMSHAATRASSPEEQMWQWQDFYRLMVGSSLGLEPGAYPTDPLARLQAQLQQQYDPDVTKDLYAQPPDFRQALASRGRGLELQLQQRQAGLGAPEAYGGLIGQQQRAREALAQQAGAAWFPTAQAEQQKLQQQTDQLLQSIAQMELETTLAYTGAGL